MSSYRHDDYDMDGTDGCILLVACVVIAALSGLGIGLFILQAVGAW